MTIKIPGINGEVECGITVGVDASLSDDKQLPILCLATRPALHADVRSNAAVWALRQTHDQNALTLLVNGVVGLIDVGLICESDDKPDGDWKKVLSPIEQEEADAQRILAMANKDEMKKAVTVALATKANYWLMNHHTGQGQVAGYAKKVLEVFYPNAVTDDVVTAAHSLGHFCSTRKVMELADIAGVKLAKPFVWDQVSTVSLSQDSKLRFASMPAGTHRLAIAYEAAKRLVRSVYASYCPDVNDFMAIPPMRDMVLEKPVAYHIGASYLTGAPRADYQDTDMNAYLGRLGTFIQTLYGKSTLAKSPHLTIARIESYDDYDADFKSALANVQLAQATARGKIAEKHIAEFQATPETALAEIRALFKGVSKNPAKPSTSGTVPKSK